MSFIISDESGTSGAVHRRDAWGWPREERPTYRTQAAPSSPRTERRFSTGAGHYAGRGPWVRRR